MNSYGFNQYAIHIMLVVAFAAVSTVTDGARVYGANNRSVTNY